MSTSDDELLEHLSDRPDDGIEGRAHGLANNSELNGFRQLPPQALDVSRTASALRDEFHVASADGSDYHSGQQEVYPHTSANSAIESYASAQSDVFSFASAQSDVCSFTSAKSDVFSFASAQSDVCSFASAKSDGYALASAQPRATSSPVRPQETKQTRNVVEASFQRAVRTLSLKPTLMEEQNWSGQGQHVEFQPGQYVPLTRTSDEPIGTSATAHVEEVRCRRVLLARKSMRLSHRMNVETVLREVQHLQRLSHPRIVRLMGTYFQGQRLSILMYPVADWNLTQFLDLRHQTNDTIISNRGLAHWTLYRPVSTMVDLPDCLSGAVAYIHAQKVVHLDIKPANVLVRKLPPRWNVHIDPGYRVCLCDFGLPRDFFSKVQSQTSSFPGMTAMYASPEVTANLPHGRAADILSLGCVFLEIATTVAAHPEFRFSIDRFAAARLASSEPRDDSFQGNPSAVNDWIAELQSIIPPEPWFKFFRLIKPMVAHDPASRPVAASCLLISAVTRSCCRGPREELKAHY